MPVAPATSKELSRVRVSGNGIGGTCTRGALAQKDEPGRHSDGAMADFARGEQFGRNRRGTLPVSTGKEMTGTSN